MTPRAQRYAEIRETRRVHERALFASPRIPSELELQARWFAGDFGKEFLSTHGDKIDIIQFGIWNREAGPDFRDAAIRINAGEPINGCIDLTQIVNAVNAFYTDYGKYPLVTADALTEARPSRTTICSTLCALSRCSQMQTTRPIHVRSSIFRHPT